MKQLIAVLVLLALSAVCNAEPLSFVNGDGSEETDLCIAAAVGAPDLNTRATRLGIRNFTNDDVLCNDMPLNEFMRHYRNVKEGESVVTSVRKGAPRVPPVGTAAQP
ncbi:MAG: hypothetical protein SV422_08005 [Pseudomonadota bacterium]|nr:hypothetical protein [Pseudomonadota bacterium]